MGNICRSPTAEGVFSQLLQEKGSTIADQFTVDSAGTHAYHTDEAPDLRAQNAARERGIDLAEIRARKVKMGDYEDFDYLLAMDDDNYSILMNACPEQHQEKIKYFLEFLPQGEVREVPDPYYGGNYGFERVLDLAEEASEGFLDWLFKNEDIK